MPEDEYILDTPPVRAFVEQVRAALAAAPPREALEALRPAFAALLADQQWLPDAYQLPAAESGMGGGIARHELAVDLGTDGHLDEPVLHVTNDSRLRPEFHAFACQ